MCDTVNLVTSNVVQSIKSKLKNLPANTVLGKGTAPVERWEGIKEASRDIKRHVFNVMSSKNPVDMNTISDISDGFHDLEEAFSRSIPVYPNPWEHVEAMQKQSKEKGQRVMSYIIQYYAGSQNDDCLVKYRDSSDESWVPDLSNDYLGSFVRDFTKGYEKIERFVVDGLKNSSLSSQKALDKVEDMLHEQEKNISYVCSKESVVKDKGITVDWTYWAD